jgi:hypothetical protein
MTNEKNRAGMGTFSRTRPGLDNPNTAGVGKNNNIPAVYGWSGDFCHPHRDCQYCIVVGGQATRQLPTA